MIIKLSPEECHLAVLIASTRQTSAALKRLRDSVDEKSWLDSFLTHFYGCVGEIAAAKALRVPWPAWIDRFTSVSDLETHIEVRHRVKDEHELIIRPDDGKNKYYVHTSGYPERVTIHGFILGKDAMKDEYKQRHGGKRVAYFVPKEALKPAELLRKAIHG